MTKPLPNSRQPDVDLDPMFPDRWSPRAYLPQAVDEATLQTLFEAARWAPSCFNAQPWVFAYATDGATRAEFDACLVEGNHWAKSAPVLVFVCAKKTFSHNGKPNAFARFDTGAAWMALALQARRLGLHSHAMAGFDAEAAAKVIGADENVDVIAAVAVGFRGDPETIESEKMRASESPNGRNAVSTFAFKGKLSLEKSE